MLGYLEYRFGPGNRLARWRWPYFLTFDDGAVVALEKANRLARMREMVSGTTYAVYDAAFRKTLREMPWGEWWSGWEGRPLFCRLEYLKAIQHWIESSKLNRIQGLERFTQRHLINGVTQTFDDAYFRHRHRRLRFLRGEYAYHRRVFENHLFLEEAPLDRGDFVIISAPFCSTGCVPEGFASILDQAKQLEVPVIVDCAYFGTCHGLDLDLRHPAIESVSFSLTKGLGLGEIRSGIRFSDIDNESPICQQNKYDHTVLGAAKIGLYMMSLFSPDYIPTRFLESQSQVCDELGILPTPCMHLALGGDDWDHFKIDGRYNRLGIRDLVKARFQGKI